MAAAVRSPAVRRYSEASTRRSRSLPRHRPQNPPRTVHNRQLRLGGPLDYPLVAPGDVFGPFVDDDRIDAVLEPGLGPHPAALALEQLRVEHSGIDRDAPGDCPRRDDIS